MANEGEARETIASLQLRLKSHFLDEPLESVVVLAADIFKEVVEKMESWDIVEQFFRFKSHIFTAPFNQLNASRLLDNLQAYKIRKNDERREIINQLKLRIDNIYADEKIKPEKLEEYTNGLVMVLQKTSEIEKFSKVLQGYMPKYNELKHFNAQRIAGTYYQALQD